MAGEPAQALKYTVWPLACASMARQVALSAAKARPAALALKGEESAATPIAALVMRAITWRRGMGLSLEVLVIGGSVSACFDQPGPKLP
jgi:hypothetical protein